MALGEEDPSVSFPQQNVPPVSWEKALPCRCFRTVKKWDDCRERSEHSRGRQPVLSGCEEAGSLRQALRILFHRYKDGTRGSREAQSLSHKD